MISQKFRLLYDRGANENKMYTLIAHLYKEVFEKTNYITSKDQ